MGARIVTVEIYDELVASTAHEARDALLTQFIGATRHGGLATMLEIFGWLRGDQRRDIVRALAARLDWPLEEDDVWWIAQALSSEDS